MRDRSQVLYAKVLTKYDSTKLDQILCVVSVEKSVRAKDPSGLEIKISHGNRSGSTLP